MLFCTHFRFRMRKESNRIWFYLGDATTRPTFVQRSRPTDTSTIRFVVIRWCVFQLHTFIMNFVGCVCAEIFAIDACKLLPTFFIFTFSFTFLFLLLLLLLLLYFISWLVFRFDAAIDDAMWRHEKRLTVTMMSKANERLICERPNNKLYASRANKEYNFLAGREGWQPNDSSVARSIPFAFRTKYGEITFFLGRKQRNEKSSILIYYWIGRAMPCGRDCFPGVCSPTMACVCLRAMFKSVLIGCKP